MKMVDLRTTLEGVADFGVLKMGEIAGSVSGYLLRVMGVAIGPFEPPPLLGIIID